MFSSAVNLNSAEKENKNDCQEKHGRDPPDPMQTAWFDFWAELARNKLVVVEVLVREIKAAGRGRLRPPGAFVRAALRAGPGVYGKIRAAIGTGIHASSIQLDWAVIFRPAPTAGSFHPGIFLVGDQVEAHEHIVMRHRLHVLHVIGEPRERAESKETEHFHGAFLFADEFGLDLFQTALAGDVDEIGDQGLGEAVGAKLRMNINADPGDVPFPSAELLVERGASNDFTAL